MPGYPQPLQRTAESREDVGIRRPAPRRAPRLGPDELLAPHITRLGRFRKRDPRKPKELPGCARVIGVIAWAAFIAEMLRRARRSVQPPDAPPEADQGDR